jgi:rhodanese-related sulfurtransferase
MTIQTINSTILKSWIDNNQAILIDVREPAEFNNQHIDGANLAPLSKITINDLDKYNKNNEGKKIVIYCGKGGRGNSACEKLKADANNIELYNLEGGITAWIASGGEVTKKSGFFLPLDRQVQLTIGLCVFLASLASIFINTNFAYLTAFFGAGLIFAGLTGFCGLALLMAKMPWNKDKKLCKTFCATR